VLSAAANADAFAVVPRGVGMVEAGAQVTIEMFKWPETREWVDGR
jgi:molybdopterin biosynthesis enzyme